MTETTTQPRFITRLPTGASLRGGSRGFYGSTMARADEAIFLWCYNSKLGRLLRGFGTLSQCLTSFQPLAMTETTTQPRFIIRLPTGASLRGGSRGFYGSTMARADEAIFLWCYNSKLGRLLRGF